VGRAVLAAALMDATRKRAQKLEAKGKQVDFKELLQREPGAGTTKIRNVDSAHWTRWLGPEHPCLVPFTSFSEYDTMDGKKVPVWFAPDESRPPARLRRPVDALDRVQKAKEGEITADSSLRSSPASRTLRSGASIRRRCR
jgi:hypothetical protein